MSTPKQKQGSLATASPLIASHKQAKLGLRVGGGGEHREGFEFARKAEVSAAYVMQRNVRCEMRCGYVLVFCKNAGKLPS